MQQHDIRRSTDIRLPEALVIREAETAENVGEK